MISYHEIVLHKQESFSMKNRRSQKEMNVLFDDENHSTGNKITKVRARLITLQIYIY